MEKVNKQYLVNDTVDTLDRDKAQACDGRAEYDSDISRAVYPGCESTRSTCQRQTAFKPHQPHYCIQAQYLKTLKNHTRSAII
jgi:hypothetical protein